DVEQVLQAAGEAVQLPDDQHIARPEVIEETVQLRAVPPAAGGALLIDPIAADGPQRRHLGGRILVLRLRHACVAEQHGPLRMLQPLSCKPCAIEFRYASGIRNTKVVVTGSARFGCDNGRLTTGNASAGPHGAET